MVALSSGSATFGSLAMRSFSVFSRSMSRAVFHASATLRAPFAVPAALFWPKRPRRCMSAMNENDARPMRINPRQAKPTRKEPIVEKSERPSSPKSSPTAPAAEY